MLKVALKHNKSISQPIIGSPTVTLKYTINKQSQISLPTLALATVGISLTSSYFVPVPKPGPGIQTPNVLVSCI
jgi:ABC-type Co2+ transport system permease subunit